MRARRACSLRGTRHTSNQPCYRTRQRFCLRAQADVDSNDWLLVSPTAHSALLALARRVSNTCDGAAMRYPTSFDTLSSPNGGGALRVQNVFWHSSSVRKAHVELAVSDTLGLTVLHVVLFPHTALDLPVFGLDVVAFGPRITLALVDVCPTRADRSLPRALEECCQQLAAESLSLPRRETPAWAASIFSSHALVCAPSTAEQIELFCCHAERLLNAYVEEARACLVAEASALQPRALASEIQAGVNAFCELNLQNDKTRRILVTALGQDVGDRYMRECMFDPVN